MDIQFRDAQRQDSLDILQVRQDAILAISTDYYSVELLQMWAGSVTDRLDDFNDNKDHELRIVAEANGEIIGIGVLVTARNELRALYVSPKAARHSVGSQLLAKLENMAKNCSLQFLQLNSSLNAEKFYLKNGYRITGHDGHVMNNGVSMASVQMRKELSLEQL